MRDADGDGACSSLPRPSSLNLNDNVMTKRELSM
jgi:hypothetical protein